MVATFLMVSTCSIIMQSLGNIVQRAPAVGAIIVFVTIFVCHGSMSPSEVGALFDERGHSLSN